MEAMKQSNERSQHCSVCDGLSAAVLITLAEDEYSSNSFPQHSYYHHQPSYNELLISAKEGCTLCRLISVGFQKSLLIDNTWKGSTREEAIKVIEEEGEMADIRIAITAEHLYTTSVLEDVRLFDVMMVQVGLPDFTATGGDDRSQLSFCNPSSTFDFECAQR